MKPVHLCQGTQKHTVGSGHRISGQMITSFNWQATSLSKVSFSFFIRVQLHVQLNAYAHGLDA